MMMPMLEVLVWVWVFVELSSSLMMRTIPLILWKGFLLAISCLGFESEVFPMNPEGIKKRCLNRRWLVASSKLKLETEHDALEKAFSKLNL